MDARWTEIENRDVGFYWSEEKNGERRTMDDEGRDGNGE
jgi:hypothetical protein